MFLDIFSVQFLTFNSQAYPITVSWPASGDGENAGEIEVFPINHAVPFSKMLTFYRSKEFSINASYSGPIPYPDRAIGMNFVFYCLFSFLQVLIFNRYLDNKRHKTITRWQSAKSKGESKDKHARNNDYEQRLSY